MFCCLRNGFRFSLSACSKNTQRGGMNYIEHHGKYASENNVFKNVFAFDAYWRTENKYVWIISQLWWVYIEEAERVRGLYYIYIFIYKFCAHSDRNTIYNLKWVRVPKKKKKNFENDFQLSPNLTFAFELELNSK